MKVVIFCGGEGTRLKEETEFKPKPLVKIGDMPILWHIMKIYSHYGHKEFILPLGYKGEMIKDFFVNFNWRVNDFTLNLKTKEIENHKNHNDENWKIHFVDTGLKSKTSLRLYNVRELLEGEEMFMLTYGDGIADIDISKLVEFHKNKGKLVTISGINVMSKFGVLDVGEDSLAKKFKEKPQADGIINGGFMVFDKKVLEHLTNENTMIVKSLLPMLAEKGEIAVYRHEGFWDCMDTYRDYLALNKMWSEGNTPWVVWDKK